MRFSLGRRIGEPVSGQILHQLPQQIVEDLAKARQASEVASASLYEQARSYHNTVISIAYASFFAIWVFSRSYLPPKATVAIALLMGISIILYVFFEILNMLFLQFATVKAMKAARIPRVANTLEELFDDAAEQRTRAERNLHAIQKSGLALLGAWPFFFVPSVLTGFGAGLLLLWNFLAFLLPTQLNYWPT